MMVPSSSAVLVSRQQSNVSRGTGRGSRATMEVKPLPADAQTYQTVQLSAAGSRSAKPRVSVLLARQSVETHDYKAPEAAAADRKKKLSLVADEPYEVFSIKDSNHTLVQHLFGPRVAKWSRQHRKLFQWMDAITFLYQVLCTTVIPIMVSPQSSLSLPLSLAFFVVQYYVLFSFSFVIQVPLLRRSLKSFNFYFLMVEFTLFTLAVWSSFCFSLAGVFYAFGLWLAAVVSAAMHDTFSIGRRRRFRYGYIISWIAYLTLLCCVSFRLMPGMCIYRLDLEQGLVLETALSPLNWTPWSFSFNDLAFNTGITVVIVLGRAALSGKKNPERQIMLASKLIVYETWEGTERHERLLMHLEDVTQHLAILNSYRTGHAKPSKNLRTSIVVPGIPSKQTKKEEKGNRPPLVLSGHTGIVTKTLKSQVEAPTPAIRRMPNDNKIIVSHSPLSSSLLPPIEGPIKFSMHLASLPIYLLTDEEAATSLFMFAVQKLRHYFCLYRSRSSTRKATQLLQLQARSPTARTGSSGEESGSNTNGKLSISSNGRLAAASLSDRRIRRKRKKVRAVVLFFSYLIQVFVVFSHTLSPIIPMESPARVRLLSVSTFFAVAVMPVVDSRLLNLKILKVIMKKFAVLFFLFQALLFSISLSAMFCFSSEGILFTVGYYTILMRYILYDCFTLAARKHLRFPFLYCTFALIGILLLVKTRILSEHMCFYRYDFKLGLVDDLVLLKTSTASTRSSSITSSMSEAASDMSQQDQVAAAEPEESTQPQAQNLAWSFSASDLLFNCGFTLCLLFLQHLLALFRHPGACIVLHSSLNLVEVFGEK